MIEKRHMSLDMRVKNKHIDSLRRKKLTVMAPPLVPMLTLRHPRRK